MFFLLCLGVFGSNFTVTVLEDKFFLSSLLAALSAVRLGIMSIWPKVINWCDVSSFKDFQLQIKIRICTRFMVDGKKHKKNFAANLILSQPSCSSGPRQTLSPNRLRIL